MTKEDAIKFMREYFSEEVVWDIVDALKQEQDEPVAYGMRDTMIGNGNRMMYVRLDKGQDGCTVPLYERPQPRKRILFPTMLRKMWSGSEVQDWLDKNVNKE